MTNKIILGIVALAAVGVGVYFMMANNDAELAAINSFEECAAAGYPVMESFPEQCKTPDGRTFVREVENPITTPTGCTKDAKICPDGSSVGRVEPSCQFAACPVGPSNPPRPVACTADAKLCPNGAYVGRAGPNCEFTPCPQPTPTVACTMDAKLCPDGSYVGRVGPNCEFALCTAGSM